jgi:hypothetical protein
MTGKTFVGLDATIFVLSAFYAKREETEQKLHRKL